MGFELHAKENEPDSKDLAVFRVALERVGLDTTVEEIEMAMFRIGRELGYARNWMQQLKVVEVD